MKSSLPKSLRFPDISMSKWNHKITQRKCKWVFLIWGERRLIPKTESRKQIALIIWKSHTFDKESAQRTLKT